MFTQEELDAIRAADLEMEREECAKRPKMTEAQRLRWNAYQREYQRKKREANREAYNAYHREYAKNNRDKMNAAMRRYYQKRKGNKNGNIV